MVDGINMRLIDWHILDLLTFTVDCKIHIVDGDHSPFFFKGVNNNNIDSSKRPDPAPLALESATLDQISSPALKPFTNTQ